MYSAEEYRNLLKMVFNLAIKQQEDFLKGFDETYGMQSTRYNYNQGYLAGLKEGLRKVNASEFLSNPEFKNE